jgi:hypothetical protein
VGNGGCWGVLGLDAEGNFIAGESADEDAVLLESIREDGMTEIGGKPEERGAGSGVGFSERRYRWLVMMVYAATGCVTYNARLPAGTSRDGRIDMLLVIGGIGGS